MSASLDPYHSPLLAENMDSLEAAADDVRAEMAAAPNVREEIKAGAVWHFYHMVLLEVAELLPADQFAKCIQISREQMRRPVR
jgi:hypothetical protein